MRIVSKACFLTLVLLLGAPSMASAETSAQFAAAGLRAPDDPIVNGFRLSFLYGGADKVSGLDVGLFSVSEVTTLSGVALVFGISKVDGNLVNGAAFALVNIHSGQDSGLNAAFINKVKSTEGAVNLGFVNIADETTMADIGCLNVAKSTTVQLGMINVTKELKGFQLGFINVAENGFLPVFPFFNIPKQ
jgi:hypothetical protein